MTRRFGLVALMTATAMIALAYAGAFLPGGAPAWSEWLLAIGTSTCMMAMIVLGAARGDRPLGRLLSVVVGTVFVLISGCFALALLLPPETVGDALWLGLPRRAAILLYGVGVLPIFLLPVTYTMTFDTETLGEGDLERVRDAAIALRSGAPPPVRGVPSLRDTVAMRLPAGSEAASVSAPAVPTVGGGR